MRRITQLAAWFPCPQRRAFVGFPAVASLIHASDIEALQDDHLRLLQWAVVTAPTKLCTYDDADGPLLVGQFKNGTPRCGDFVAQLCA